MNKKYGLIKQLNYLKKFSQSPFETYEEIRKNLGDVVHFTWPTSSVILFKGQDVKELLEVNKDKIKKGTQTQFLKPLIGNSLPVSEGKYWRKQRRIVQKSFHHSTFEKLLPQIIIQLEEEISKWDFNKKVNLSEKISLTTFNTSFFYFFGNVSNTLREELFRELNIATELLFRKMKPIPIPFWVPTAAHRRIFSTKKKIDSIIDSIIKEKKENTDSSSLLGRIISDNINLSQEEIRNEILALVVAGHDTTSTSIIWSMYHILKDEQIRSKLKAEVSSTKLSYSALKDLPYIEAIFKETIRLYPPLHLLARTSTEDIQINGTSFKSGTNFIISQYMIQRDSRNFDSPHDFKPSRFIQHERRDSLSGSYIPFSIGSRRCIGENLSYNIVKIIIHTLINKHDFKTHHLDLKPVHEIILRPNKDLLI